MEMHATRNQEPSPRVWLSTLTPRQPPQYKSLLWDQYVEHPSCRFMDESFPSAIKTAVAIPKVWFFSRSTTWSSSCPLFLTKLRESFVILTGFTTLGERHPIDCWEVCFAKEFNHFLNKKSQRMDNKFHVNTILLWFRCFLDVFLVQQAFAHLSGNIIQRELYDQPALAKPNSSVNMFTDKHRTSLLLLEYFKGEIILCKAAGKSRS